MNSAKMSAATKAASKRPAIYMYNSLDDRYGSTYRFRALADLLDDSSFSIKSAGESRRIVEKFIRAWETFYKQYDICITQKFNPLTLIALMGARIRCKPTLVDWDDLDADLQGAWWKRLLTSFCESIGPTFASAITTHSRGIQERLVQQGREATLISQGFNDQLFSPSTELRDKGRTQWKLAPHEHIVGHLCTFTNGGAMNLPTILDHWVKLRSDPHIRFLLVGGGPLRETIDHWITNRKLNDKVIQTGLLPQTEIPKALSAMDVAVVYMEDRPANRVRISLKVLEYLAMNIPVVGQVVGETERLFGPLIHVANEANLANRIVSVLSNPSKEDTASKVSSFRWNEQRDPFRSTIDQLLSGENASCR